RDRDANQGAIMATKLANSNLDLCFLLELSTKNG
ncbi:hypothetical protein V12B01_24854, partial [Vibrio splendidus 12B01]